MRVEETSVSLLLQSPCRPLTASSTARVSMVRRYVHEQALNSGWKEKEGDRVLLGEHGGGGERQGSPEKGKVGKEDHPGQQHRLSKVRQSQKTNSVSI